MKVAQRIGPRHSLLIPLLAVVLTLAVLGIAWKHGVFDHKKSQPVTHPLASAKPSAASTGAACGTDPASCGYPTAASTGVPAGHGLKVVPDQARSGPGWKWNDYGWIEVTEAGVTLDSLDIKGSVQNKYAGLTVTNTRIRCTNENAFCLTLAANSSVSDTEIGGGDDGKTYSKAIGVFSGGAGHGTVIQRVNIHHTMQGLRIDGGTTLLNSWVHDLPMGDPPLQDAHTECVMTTGGGDIVIRHNNLSSGNTATLFVQWGEGNPRIGSYLVENNLLTNVTKNGQVSSFGVDIENKGITGPITVRNNTFGYGWQVGPIQAPAGSTIDGNLQVDGVKAPSYAS